MAKDKKDKKDKKEPAKKALISPLLIIFSLLAITIGCGAGYFIGSMLNAPAPEADPDEQALDVEENVTKDKKVFAYFDLDPITANLNEPRLARYVRVTMTLAVTPKNKGKVEKSFAEHMPEIKHTITLYLANCSLDQVRGAQNLNSLRRELRDKLNQQLWPDRKPMLDHILFKEFTVQ